MERRVKSFQIKKGLQRIENRTAGWYLVNREAGELHQRDVQRLRFRLVQKLHKMSF